MTGIVDLEQVNKFYGDYLINAQGEDVVAGIRTPEPIAKLGEDMPKVYEQLVGIRAALEKHWKFHKHFSRDVLKAVPVSEVTVANRIRSLADRNLVRVTAQEDIWAIGYDLVVLVDVFVRGRTAEAVATDLARLEQVGAVSITMTSPELIVQIFARDRADLLHVIEDEVARIEGVSAVESLVVLETIKFRSDYGELAGL